MKKNYFIHLILLCTLVLFASSCSSDNEEIVSTETGELQDVRFNISNFSSEVTEMRSAKASSIKYLSYMVFNDKSLKVAEGTFNDEIPSSLNMKLKKGTYSVHFFASEIAYKPSSFSFIGYTVSGFEPTSLKSDALAASMDIEVAETEIERKVTLTRIVARIEIALSDIAKMPADVMTLTPILVGKSQYLNMPLPPGSDLYFRGEPTIPTHTLVPYYSKGQLTVFTTSERSDLDETVYSSLKMGRTEIDAISFQNPITFYMPHTEEIYVHSTSGEYNDGFDLYLQATRTDRIENQKYPQGNDNIVFFKRIKTDIKLAPNTLIKLSGKLFGNDGLNVEIDENWGGIVEEEF